MPEPETRYPCPVCLGVRMSKLHPSSDRTLTLDYCQRCGGIWFDRDEVAQLRKCDAKAFAAKVTLQPDAYRMKCHSCHASMPRNAERCPVCRWKNVIECPTCERTLERARFGRHRIDICKRCRGAWFDNVELAEIWNVQTQTLARRTSREEPGQMVAEVFLLDSLLFMPELPFLAAHGAVEAAQAVPGAAGAIADTAGGAVEATGELAQSVFETIAEIISGIFS